jgi:streptogramin lyase
MTKKLSFIFLSLCALLLVHSNADGQVSAKFVGRYSIGNYSSAGGAAEITAFDPASKRMFVINGPDSSLRIVNVSNPALPVQISKISIKPYGIDLTSVACKNGLVAIAVIDSNGKTNPSSIVFMDINGNFISKVKAGANSDNIVFTPDGSKLLVANEGEPNSDYTVDPEGSISIINLSGGAAGLTQANVQTAGFTAFNTPTIIDPKIRIFGRIQSGGIFLRNSTVAEDLEPEYIAISEDGTTAWATCQENNCVAVINIQTATITSLYPLGFKNFNLPSNGFDPSDKDGAGGTASAKIGNWPVFGLFLPDGISSYKVGNQNYFVTANEGDSRADWGAANLEENRVKDAAYVLDTAKFGGVANVTLLKTDSALGRLTVTNRYGDFDNDGKFDSIFAFGARSFSIWNATTGALVWDSKDDFERITLASLPANFNADHTKNALDDRSDNKGPEPESVTIGKIKDSTYAFVALERIGGIMIYNITAPTAPYFVQYMNTRNFSVIPNQANIATVGDLGPEGIVFIPSAESPNGQNMIMLSNEISSTVAFYSINTPETENVTKLQDYKNNTAAAIGTFQGINYKEAGFSTLFPIPNTNGTEFWTCSDRGVNIDCASANTASCRPTYDKMYAFPSYTPKIHRIRIAGDSIQILQSITIKRPNGTGATGIINPTGLGSTATEVASTDTVLNCANFALKTTPKDTFGIDPEGLVVDQNGNFWLCEEGGATIWKLNPNGVLLKRFTPYANLAGVQAVDVQIDSVFKYRKNNRGFEGISIAPNGKIYAIIQSAILYPVQATGDASRVHRILEIDPATGNQRMIVYLNDGIIGAAGANQIRTSDWKIGDMAAVNDSIFLVLEAAARGTTDIKRLYQININQAIAVHSGLYSGLTLEGLVDSTGLANNGIKAVTKTLALDLLASGWPSVLDKAEGLAIINDSTIAIANDNDFGQKSALANGIATETGNLSHLITYRLSGTKKLPNYTPSVLSVSSQSAYLTPAAPGVKLDAILTTGDAIKGYKMAGTPDGLGAFDNGNGTFTLLMNHEFGNTAGVIRAHGSKGAFVSKWIINKADLTVVSGSDLIKRVNVWNTTTQSYTLLDSTNASALTAFNRFCSADLPAVSAFFNATTGKGTQERIFMNGEESGNEGRALGHIVTGVSAGTTYELPALGKFSWENSVASPLAQDKTIVAGMDDSTPGQVYMYIGTKTTTGTDIEKAGLTNGKLYGIAVTGLATETGTVPAANSPFSLVDLGIVKDSTGASLNTRSNNLGVTSFLRPEDGAWDPSNPNDFYFATTNAITAPSRLWRAHFTDIKNPELGGTITAVLDGTEGQKMLDNLTIDKYGHVLLVEDVGGNVHIGKTWQYTIATDKFVQIAAHDSSRFISGRENYLTQDEEASGILDVQDILGAGNFLVVDQAHYALPGELVEGGQLLRLFNPASAIGIQPKTIAQARAINPNDTVKVKGIVTRAWGRFIYIQDSTGAIGVRQASGAMVDSLLTGGIKEGDLVEVVASRGDFNNYAQLALRTGAFGENSRVTVLDRNQPMPAPKLLTLKQLNTNGEQYESQLVKVVNLQTASTGAFAASTNYTVWDGSTTGDSLLYRVIASADTEMDDAPAINIPAGKFTFEGTLIQFCATPTSGCTLGYQLQGVRKYEIIAQPALSTFNLVAPVSGTKIVTSAANTTAVQCNWNKSAYATQYKWFITEQSGNFTNAWLRSTVIGTDSNFSYPVNEFDTLVAKHGISRGDSVSLKWSVYAYYNGDSLLASQSNAIWFVRTPLPVVVPVLNPFNLLAPVNNARIEVEQNDNTPVVITWESSAAGATYKLLLDEATANFSNPWLVSPSDNGGTATQLSLTSDHIDDLLDSKTIAKGDSAHLIWTVRAFKATDSLQSTQTYHLTAVRKKTVGLNELNLNGLVTLYPNPTKGNSNLLLRLTQAETIHIMVTDIQGKVVVASMEYAGNAGNQEIELPTSTLQNGIYFVNINIGGQAAQVKLVVMH